MLNNEFYPTPKTLLEKIFTGMEWKISIPFWNHPQEREILYNI